MPLFPLDRRLAFPPPELAEPEGVLAIGGDLRPERLLRAYARWAELGLPGVGAFGLEVHRADAAPAGSQHLWIEPRGTTALAWRPRLGAAGWRDLLGSGEQR